MPRIVIAARCRCAGIVAAVSFCSLDPSIAHAQQSVAEQLPPVEVTKSDDQNRTRARAIGDGETGRRRARSNRAPTGTGSSGSGSEAVASDGPYVFGNSVTLADALLVPQLYNARRIEMPSDDFPKLIAAVDKANELEAFKIAAPEAQPDAT